MASQKRSMLSQTNDQFELIEEDMAPGADNQLDPQLDNYEGFSYQTMPRGNLGLDQEEVPRESTE